MFRHIYVLWKIFTYIYWVIPRERYADPTPSLSEVDKFSFFVPKDAQSSETYEFLFSDFFLLFAQTKIFSYKKNEIL